MHSNGAQGEEGIREEFRSNTGMACKITGER